MAALELILVPMDGSPPSLAALAHAVALAEDANARVDVLHVEAPEGFTVGSATPLTPDARRDAEAALDVAIRQASTALSGRFSRRTVSGDPLRAIVETARDGHYDLVVLGTHGRIGRLHELVGSVAEAVVRNAPCPVLTVREPSSGYQSFADRRHRRPALGDAIKTSP